MDLSGHQRFARGATGLGVEARHGEALLSAGWAALAAARAETVDIRLRSGVTISGIMAIRIDEAMAEVSTVQGQWTHYFMVADVVMVHVIVRGAKRGR